MLDRESLVRERLDLFDDSIQTSNARVFADALPEGVKASPHASRRHAVGLPLQPPLVDWLVGVVTPLQRKKARPL